jgi:hypothetical protein
MSDNALAIRGTFDDTEKVAGAMVKSGYFTDTREVSQAIVKILAGREMGFGPFASMTGVYIIQGRPSVGANLMASAVKRSGRYDYRVLEMTDKVCTVEYTQGGKVIGQSSFTIEDARKAGTKNLDKFPRNMLFARAMSNGVRWFCPDVFDGAPVYTPEELGADVNETGEVIDYTPPTVTVYPPSPEPPVSPPAENTVPAEKQQASAEVKPRFTPTELRDKLHARAEKLTGKAGPEVKQAVAPTLEGILGGEDQRHEFIKWLTNGRFDTLSLLTDGELLALHEWLKPSYNRPAKVWLSTVPEAVAECTAAHREYLQANGAQGELL